MCPNPGKMINLGKNIPIVRTNEPVLLVGGGQIGPEDLNQTLIRAKCVVAADGGANHLMRFGLVPDAVVGDFDSLEAVAEAQIPPDRLFRICEQDSTDFDKALRSIDTPLALGVGFLGGRLDHQLAVLNTLSVRQDRPCILIGSHEVVFHAPPQISLNLGSGDVVSLFPFRHVTGRSQGLEWPVDGLQFAPNGQIGTSNRAVSDVELQMDGPGMLVMLPRDALDQVMQAFLSGQTGRWPALLE